MRRLGEPLLLGSWPLRTFVIEKKSTWNYYRPAVGSKAAVSLLLFHTDFEEVFPILIAPMSLTSSDFTDRLVSHTKSPCSWYSTGPHGRCLEDCENADPSDCVQQPTIVLMPYYNSDRPENEGFTVSKRTDLSEVRVRAVCLWQEPADLSRHKSRFSTESFTEAQASKYQSLLGDGTEESAANALEYAGEVIAGQVDAALQRSLITAESGQIWYWAIEEAENEEQLEVIGEKMTERLGLPSHDCQKRDIDTGYRYSLATSQSKKDEDLAPLQELKKTFSGTTQGTPGSKSSNGLTRLVERLTSRGKTD